MKRIVLALACLPLLKPGLALATDFDLYAADSAVRVAPAVVLLQGANVDKGEYSLFATQVAKAGFNVIVANVFRKVDGAPQPGFFTSEDTVNESIQQLKLENANPNSKLFQRVDPNAFAVVGHSFGGMVTLYSVDGRCMPQLCVKSYTRAPELKAAVVLGTSTMWQGHLLEIDTHGTPVALISGFMDSFAPPDFEASTFDNLLSPKMWLAITGANHYALTNDNPPSGARPDPHTQNISQADSIGLAAGWTARFLRVYLMSDSSARAQIDAAAASLPEGLSVARVSLDGTH